MPQIENTQTFRGRIKVKTNIFKFFRPKNIIYVMELFDNYNNHQLTE
jgi:hypothetical protein